MDSKIEEIIDYLNGTCNSLDDACEEILGTDSTTLTKEELAHIDENIFCCETCGWWVETSDMAENQEQICIDCSEDV